MNAAVNNLPGVAATEGYVKAINNMMTEQQAIDTLQNQVQLLKGAASYFSNAAKFPQWSTYTLPPAGAS